MHRHALALLVLSVGASIAHAQRPPTAPMPAIGRTTPAGGRVAHAHAITTAPIIDGRLDDASWKDAEPLTEFVQREQSEGAPVSERTEVKLLTDGEALYVGAWLRDREPQGIVAGEKIRDVNLTNSDYFAIILDTYLDRQNGFVFATTPAGIEYDGQVVREGEGGGVFQTGQTRAQVGAMGGFNVNWDGSWQVRTSQDSLGWYAEMRIPFSTLRYGAGAQQSWGINFARMIRRRNEESFWAFIPRQFNLYRLSLAGTLEGIPVPVKRVATITPFMLAKTSRDYLLDSKARFPTEVGGEAKYGVTPSLTLDLTYNTDFAQVEVDEERTNLTRFPLFFPEKRPFFLENAGIFSAGTPQAVELFFSRRIGIDTAGTPVPIIGGGRLTGRVGGTTVGLLQLFTENVPGRQPGNSYSVVRASREIGRRSRVGLIGVERLATGNTADHNLTLGGDARVGLGDNVTVDGWVAKTETPGRHGDDIGFSGRAAYANGTWNNSLRVVQVGEDFNPEVGFLNRTGGYRYYEATLMRLVRKPEWAWFRQWNPHVSYRGYYGLDDFYQTGQLHFDVTEIELSRGGRFGPELNLYHEGLQVPFEIAPGVVIPVGSYDFTGIGLDWSTDPSRTLAMLLRSDVGPFYDGSRRGGNVTFTYRQGASLTSSLLLDYNDVRLDEGNFTRTLVGTRIGWNFTPRVFVQSLVQYNNLDRTWAANARFGWLNTAGTGLFVVFNEGQEADGFFRWVRPQTRSFTVKYTKQIGTGQ